MGSSSALTYKARVAMKDGDEVLYNKIYAANQGQVHERLVTDATMRMERSTIGTYRSPPSMEGALGLEHDSLSGFVSNTCRVPNNAALSPSGADPLGVDMLDSKGLMRAKQGQPLEYLSTIRKQTQTTSQAMRMMGTYETDIAWAKKMNLFIPAQCPAPPGKYFHPDVKS